MDLSQTKQTQNPSDAPEHVPERSLPGHLADLTDHTIELFRQELRLARAELNEKLDQAKRGVGSIVSGSMVLAGGLLALLAAAVLGIGLYIPYWASALIVGGVVAVIGGIMLAAGRHELEAEQLAPKRTLEEIQRDKQLIQEHA
ncbi:MAG: phage holin family protein [Microthrixaceae bacterium]